MDKTYHGVRVPLRVPTLPLPMACYKSYTEYFKAGAPVSLPIYEIGCVFAERLSARQLNRAPIPSCVYIYVCNTSGIQLSIPICIVYGVVHSLSQDTVRSRIRSLLLYPASGGYLGGHPLGVRDRRRPEG